MKIKICGLRNQQNINELEALGPDYMGFIFYRQSPRFVADLHAETLTALPKNIHKTGVFVDEDAEEINRLIAAYHFDAIQLHGNESPEFCNLFKGTVSVIKAFGVDESFDFEQLRNYADKVDYFLFDTKTDKHGGSGKVFDWSILENYKLKVPFFLSGGLSLENLEVVKLINHPQFHGVDLNSKFELEPGLKDIDKLKKAFDLLRWNTSLIKILD
jgi:phosphoribosylanthranilate isomerase